MVLNCHVCQQQRDFEKDEEGDLICPVCGYEYKAGAKEVRPRGFAAPRRSRLRERLSRRSLSQVAKDVLSDKPKLLSDSDLRLMEDPKNAFSRAALDQHIEKMKEIEKEIRTGAGLLGNLRAKIIEQIDMSFAAGEAMKIGKESLERLSEKEKFYRSETVYLAYMSSLMDVIIFTVYAQHNHLDDAVNHWIDLYENLLSKAEPVYLKWKLAIHGIFQSDNLKELSDTNQRYEAERKFLKNKIIQNDLGYLLSDAAADPMLQASVGTFAKMPVAQMIAREGSFDVWKDPDIEVPDELAGTFRGSSQFMQMWVFYIKTSFRFGHRFAEKVLSMQKEFLDQFGDGTGTDVEAAVHIIRDEALRSVNDPLVLEIDGQTITVPFETRLAGQFLRADGLITEDDMNGQRNDGKFQLILDLGTCLEHVKSTASIAFEKLVDIVTIVDEEPQSGPSDEMIP